LGAASTDELALLFMELHAQGYLVAQVFNGLWLLPLGYLVVRSRYKPLGVLLMIGAFGYPASSVLTWTLPSASDSVHMALSLLTAAGEAWLMLWLLITGVRVPTGMQDSIAA
jgi:hypothetical protein